MLTGYFRDRHVSISHSYIIWLRWKILSLFVINFSTHTLQKSHQCNLKRSLSSHNLEFMIATVNISEGNQKPKGLFVELSDTHCSRESGNDGDANYWSQLMDRRVISSNVDRRKNADDALRFSLLEALVQLVRKLGQRSSSHWSEDSTTSERWDHWVNVPTAVIDDVEQSSDSCSHKNDYSFFSR